MPADSGTPTATSGSVGAPGSAAADVDGITDEDVSADAEPTIDPVTADRAGRAADRAAVAILLSAVLVGGLVVIALLITIATAWMRGAPSTGFTLVGRTQNYSDALAQSWPVFLASTTSVVVGVLSALLAVPILRWIDRVPVVERGPRWALALFPLLVAMPVRAAGIATFIGEDRLWPENEVTVALAVNAIWLSAGIPLAVLVGGIGRRWTSERRALILSIPLVASWVALDIAAPTMVSRTVPESSLGPLIDTAIGLAGQLPLGAAVVVMATGLLLVPTIVLAFIAFRPGRTPEPEAAADRPFGFSGVLAAVLAMTLSYAPVLITLVVGLAQGARPWQLCSEPTGCAPLINTSLLLIPTAVAAGFIAGAGYYAGWLTPEFRKFQVPLAMVIAVLLPPTTLGTSLWLAANMTSTPVGLLTMWIGQTLLAVGMAYCAIQLAHLGVPPYDPATQASFAVPPRLIRASIYAGVMGALFAAGDFAVAQQLSGDVRTIPTAAFAEAVNTWEVGGSNLTGIVWVVVTFPIFLVCMAGLMKLIPEVGRTHAESSTDAPEADVSELNPPHEPAPTGGPVPPA